MPHRVPGLQMCDYYYHEDATHVFAPSFPSWTEGDSAIVTRPISKHTMSDKVPLTNHS
jgi:hypothetical protein